MKQLRLSDFLKIIFQVRGFKPRPSASTVQAFYTSISIDDDYVDDDDEEEEEEEIRRRSACLHLMRHSGD